MTYYDEQLKLLQEQVSRHRRLSAGTKELRNQLNRLKTQVHDLENIMRNEQADVERLEGRSLAAFFYYVVGKMDTQLSKERQEAYAAKVKYDAAARELDAVEQELRRCEAELYELRGCTQRYEAALNEKAAALKAAGSPQADEILKLEERLAFLESQKKELREAISAGRAAGHTAEQVLKSLRSAKDWGTYDLLGGGLMSDMIKHSHLDDAQHSIEYLQSQLRRFKTELADIRIHADTQVNIDGFLRFADYFFDGLFADWTVMDQISRSQSQVENTALQISRTVSRLETMLAAAEREQNDLLQTRTDLILAAGT